jgi:hypothetical protein
MALHASTFVKMPRIPTTTGLLYGLWFSPMAEESFLPVNWSLGLPAVKGARGLSLFSSKYTRVRILIDHIVFLMRLQFISASFPEGVAKTGNTLEVM